MADPHPMRETILDAAEKRIRSVGYNAFSFRDLADDVGIRSASIHYHFPQKADLGVQLVQRYRERFQGQLTQIDRTDLMTGLEHFFKLYADALIVGEQVCLCAVLAAETGSLPSHLTEKVREFFKLNLDWLEALNQQFHVESKAPKPIEILTSLEGAMTIANAMGDKSLLLSVIEQYRGRYERLIA